MNYNIFKNESNFIIVDKEVKPMTAAEAAFYIFAGHFKEDANDKIRKIGAETYFHFSINDHSKIDFSNFKITNNRRSLLLKDSELEKDIMLAIINIISNNKMYDTNLNFTNSIRNIMVAEHRRLIKKYKNKEQIRESIKFLERLLSSDNYVNNIKVKLSKNKLPMVSNYV